MSVPRLDVAGIASEIRERADRAAITVRLAGSYAVRWHCEAHVGILDRMGRADIHDLDFVVSRRSGRKASALIEQMGYVPNRQIEQASDGQHMYLELPETRMGIDVYAGGMNYCHPIALEERLPIDPVTIPLAELLLSKLQVVKITEKDLQDTAILLLSHQVADMDADTINAAQIARMLAQDWGFYHTVTGNLNATLQRLDNFSLEPEQKTIVKQRAAHLAAAIEEAPKTLKWRLRARLGTKVSWYQDVEEK